MLLRIAALCALCLTVLSARARGQDTLGPGPGRVLLLRQLSWWAADGLPASDVVARETTFVFRPDSAHGWPSTGMVPVELELDPGSSLLVTLSVRPGEGIDAILVSAEEAHCGSGWTDRATSALAVLALSLLAPAHAAGEENAPLPTLTFAACDDTVLTTLDRSLTRYQPDSSTGRPAFVSVGGTLAAVWRFERHLVPGGVTARASLRGQLSGRVRLTAAGVPDSLDLSGRYRGWIAYGGPGERADTVYGTWVVDLTGSWGEDPEVRFKREFDYYVQHGRAPGGEPSEKERPAPYSVLAQRAVTDAAAADSLVALYVSATEPKTRGELEGALATAARVDAEKVLPALLKAPIRIAPSIVLNELRYRVGPGDTVPLGRDVAALLVRELPPLVMQRRRLTDREDLGDAVLDMLKWGRGFTRNAGPLLATGAAQADDPMSRDLLLFAAYQADPARYRALVETTADSVRGYGPIARAWVAGDGTLTNASWGERPGAHHSLTVFPGVDAPAEQLARYFTEVDRGVPKLAPLRMRFAAEGRDLAAELRRRFAADTTIPARAILGRYLEGLRDTAARPWLRDVLRGPAEAREAAYDLLPPDTVRDTTIVAGIQRMLLGYVAGLEPVLDTAGKPVREPWVHDERPDQRILLSEGVLASAIDPWRRQFQVMTRDSVEARVATDGMQMAWVVSPVRRTGDRFYVSVTLVPVGQQCLCGGGVNFTLERRDGQWIAVSLRSWIS